MRTLSWLVRYPPCSYVSHVCIYTHRCLCPLKPPCGHPSIRLSCLPASSSTSCDDCPRATSLFILPSCCRLLCTLCPALSVQPSCGPDLFLAAPDRLLPCPLAACSSPPDPEHGFTAPALSPMGYHKMTASAPVIHAAADLFLLTQRVYPSPQIVIFYFYFCIFSPTQPPPACLAAETPRLVWRQGSLHHRDPLRTNEYRFPDPYP